MTDGYTVAHLLQRDTPRQRVAESVVNVTPEPSERDEHVDAFGNRVTQFGVHHPHDELIVEAVSTARRRRSGPDRRRRVVERRGRSRRSVAGRRSGRDRPVPGADTLRRSQPRGRRAGRHRVRIVHAGPGDRRGRQRPVPPDLRRVHVRLDGDRRLESAGRRPRRRRRGVCQDFAHLAAGCLRSIGLAARYVSGYIETTPPAGRDRLVGADASHAWCSIWTPSAGWIDFDPTNDHFPTRRHVTVAWGRDYADVTPVRGVVIGPSRAQTLDVAVDVALI